jgi:uncharacterized RDD family membrane protein YckC
VTIDTKQLRDRRPLDGRRVKARLIDGLLLAVPFIVVRRLGFDTPLTLLLAVFVEVTYFFLCESTTGYTIGKYAMGLRVIKPDGGAPGTNSIAARNVIRVLEEPLLALLVLVGSGGRRRRIGDFVGGTAVGSVVYSSPPRPSRMRVVYPVLWLAGALLLGLALNASAGYLDDVNRICAQETSRLSDVGQPRFSRVLDAYAEMDRRIALLDPPPGESGRHHAILRLIDHINRAGLAAYHQIQDHPGDVHELRAAYARYRQLTIPLEQELVELGVTCEPR